MSHVDFKKCPYSVTPFMHLSGRFQNVPILHVDFKKYPMSCYFIPPAARQQVAYVNFDKCPCCCVENKNQEHLGDLIEPTTNAI